MRDRHQNSFQGGLGSISGLVVFFDQELAEPGKDPVITRYALLITPQGQSVKKRDVKRKGVKFDLEIKASPIENPEEYPSRRRRRDLN
jgi:hypothetical protein